MSSSCDPGTGCIIVAQWKRLPRVRISRGLPWPSWPERTANNHKVRGSSLRDGSVLLIQSQNPSCLSRGSHSSAGQSVRLITVRSAAQACVGPSTGRAAARRSSDACGVRAHALAEWRLEPRRSGPAIRIFAAAVAGLMPGRLVAPVQRPQVRTHPPPSAAAASPTSACIH